MTWFVEPETVRLDVSDGQWIEIKQELTWAEDEALAAVAVQGMRLVDPDDIGDELRRTQEIGVDMSLVNVAKLAMYIVDWSLVGANGRRVDIDGKTMREKRQILGNLAGARARELLEVIEGFQVSYQGQSPVGKAVVEVDPATSIAPSDSLSKNIVSGAKMT